MMRMPRNAAKLSAGADIIAISACCWWEVISGLADLIMKVNGEIIASENVVLFLMLQDVSL